MIEDKQTEVLNFLFPIYGYYIKIYRSERVNLKLVPGIEAFERPVPHDYKTYGWLTW